MNQTEHVFHMALFRTEGPRREKHKAVLYLCVDRDWTARCRERNGNKGFALAACAMTREAHAYCDESPRARNLMYTGDPPQDAAGFAEDLDTLGVSGTAKQRMLAAFAKCLT